LQTLKSASFSAPLWSTSCHHSVQRIVSFAAAIRLFQLLMC